MSLENKVAVVTGGSAGIGEAICRIFHANEMKVVISDINLERANSLKDELNANKADTAIAFQANVAEPDQVEALIQEAELAFGKIDVLVNNAGIGPQKMARVAESTLEDWDRVVAVNQSGVFYGMKYVLPIMLKQGGGNIINIASLAGLIASPNNISYSASKFAVVGMTKSAALEYGRKHIRVNAICPGYTETNLLNQLHDAKPELKDGLKNAIPMMRYGEVEEIAEAALWLASEKSAFMTGQTLTLDGGISL